MASISAITASAASRQVPGKYRPDIPKCLCLSFKDNIFTEATAGGNILDCGWNLIVLHVQRPHVVIPLADRAGIIFNRVGGEITAGHIDGEGVLVPGLR